MRRSKNHCACLEIFNTWDSGLGLPSERRERESEIGAFLVGVPTRH